MKVFSYYGENYIRYGKFEVKKAYTSLKVGELSIYFGSVAKVNEFFSLIKEKLKQLRPEDSVILYEDSNTVIALPISAVKGFRAVFLSNGEKIDSIDTFWENLLGYLKSLKVKEVNPLIAYNLSDILKAEEDIKSEVDNIGKEVDNIERYVKGELQLKISALEAKIKDITSKLAILSQLKEDLEALKSKELTIEEAIAKMEKTINQIEGSVSTILQSKEGAGATSDNKTSQKDAKGSIQNKNREKQ